MALSDHVKFGSEAYADRWAILLYSFPGSGKTTLAAQAPRPLIIGVDPNGHTVLQTKELRDHCRFIYLRKFDRVVKFVRQLQRDPLLQEIDTIIVDTISELQTLERLQQLPGDVLLDEKWKFNEHIYAVNNFKILTFVNEVMDLGKNVILNCHMKEDKDGDKVLVRPDISPGLLADIAAQMDGIFYLVLDNQTRRLRLKSNPQTMTKSRFPRGTTLENPTFNDLLPILEELKNHE